MSKETVKPDPKEATTQDSQLAAENIKAGKEEAPSVDFDADYEAAKQMSVSSQDQADQ